jgi:GTPase involved in cell partitioning and DNA repair
MLQKHSAVPFRLSLSIADLPGIVEGAALNRYNGLACLKHLEYSEIVLMVVDVHGFRLGPQEPYKWVLALIQDIFN